SRKPAPQQEACTTAGSLHHSRKPAPQQEACTTAGSLHHSRKPAPQQEAVHHTLPFWYPRDARRLAHTTARMSRNLSIDLPFRTAVQQMAARIRERARAAGARLDLDPSGLRGNFQVRKLIFIVAGSFEIEGHEGGEAEGGTARIVVTGAPAFVTDDQIRSQIADVFAELDA
ncbi:MAG: hypothetical protein AB7K09_10640, partial [Planctomycetota bacterium]